MFAGDEMSDCYISRKMKWVSFFSMMSVIMIHSCAYLTQVNPAKWNVFIQYFETYAVNQYAVPLFFCMSGYWFSRYVSNLEDVGIRAWCIFWKKKFFSLCVPYVCWAVIVTLICVPVIIVTNYCGGHPLLERTPFVCANLWTAIDEYLAVTRFIPKINGPLWFLRQLILIFSIAPILGILLRIRHSEWLFLLFVGMSLFAVDFGFVLGVGSTFLAWFVLGVVVAKCGWERKRIPLFMIVVCCITWIGAAIFVSLATAGNFSIENQTLLKERIIPIVGIITVWGCYDRTRLSSYELPKLLQGTFFVYCFHQAASSYVLSFGRFVFGKSDVSTLVLVPICFVFTFAISYFVFYVGSRHFPRLTSVLSGGRLG